MGTQATINSSAIPSPPPQSVLQHGRYGTFTYTIPGLTAGGAYTVRLDFDEYYWSSAGSRVFNVAINGAPVLTNFDTFAAAGGKNVAIAKSFSATASSGGTIAIAFTGMVDNAMVNGIEIYNAGQAPAARVQAAALAAVTSGTTFASPAPVSGNSSRKPGLSALDAFMALWGGDWVTLLDPKHRRSGGT
jgi:hypothetical protein